MCTQHSNLNVVTAETSHIMTLSAIYTVKSWYKCFINTIQAANFTPTHYQTSRFFITDIKTSFIQIFLSDNNPPITSVMFAFLSSQILMMQIHKNLPTTNSSFLSLFSP